jgi:hypothetical protein
MIYDLMQIMKTDSIRLATPFVTLASAIAGGGILGAVTNSVNGRVSPLYFQNIMRWHDVADIPRAAIGQGILEGLACGMIFGVILVTSLSLISKLRLQLRPALSLLGQLLGSALVAWFLGGLLAMFLAWISPEFYRRAFRGVPVDLPDMLRYAWVGGSAVGVQLGGFALLIIWIVVFRVKWKTIAG